jgi:aminoglycoside 6'-N-acetyltransferase
VGTNRVSKASSGTATSAGRREKGCMVARPWSSGVCRSLCSTGSFRLLACFEQRDRCEGGQARGAAADSMSGVAVSFRPLERGDLSLLGVWLAEPLVARWWHHDHRPAAVERDFGPSIDGSEPTEVYIATACERPFGLIQRYRVDDDGKWLEELSRVWPVPEGALSIDYLIGEREFRGRGLGTLMVATFVELGWRRHPGARDVVVPVSVGNRASWRTLERAGFRRVAAGELTPDNPRDSREHFVYNRRRPPGAGDARRGRPKLRLTASTRSSEPLPRGQPARRAARRCPETPRRSAVRHRFARADRF